MYEVSSRNGHLSQNLSLVVWLSKDCAWHRDGSYRNGQIININNAKTKWRTSVEVHGGFLKTWCGFSILPIKNMFPVPDLFSLLPEKGSCDHCDLAAMKAEASRRQYADSLICDLIFVCTDNTLVVICSVCVFLCSRLTLSSLCHSALFSLCSCFSPFSFFPLVSNC